MSTENGSSSVPSSPNGTSQSEGDSFPSWNLSEEVASPMSEEFLSLFDASSRPIITLTFLDASLKAISEYQSGKNGKSYYDVYFPANFSLQLGEKIYVYDEVGVRMKGNTSRREILDSNGNITNTCHFKISFKATFDSELYSKLDQAKGFFHDWSNDPTGKKARKDRTLFGMEKIDLKYVPRNGQNDDACVLREIYSYSSFREAGLFAPYATLAKVNFSNSHSSFQETFELIETIDKAFLKKRLPKKEAKGDLYKCVYNDMGKADLSRSEAVEKTLDSHGYSVGKRIAKGKIGVEENYVLETGASYSPCYQLKTNDDGENSDFSKMATYINEIWNVTYAGAGKERLEAVLHIDEFLRFSAISYLLGNFDDQRYNWNNYYLYFLPSSGRAIYIPYDWDWCLGLGKNLANGASMARVSPFDPMTLDGGEAANVYYATFFKANKSSQKISYHRSAYQSKYLQYVKDYASSILGENKFASLASSYEKTAELSFVKTYMATKKSVALNAVL